VAEEEAVEVVDLSLFRTFSKKYHDRMKNESRLGTINFGKVLWERSTFFIALKKAGNLNGGKKLSI
jgi:hypothetical protein